MSKPGPGQDLPDEIPLRPVFLHSVGSDVLAGQGKTGVLEPRRLVEPSRHPHQEGKNVKMKYTCHMKGCSKSRLGAGRAMWRPG